MNKLLITNRVLFPVAATIVISFAVPVHAQWPQFGGRNRDFKADSKNLAAQWSESGPKKVWSRALGDGYSSIVVDDGVLYTMHRHNDDEVVDALDANTGKTIWEYSYFAPFTGDIDIQFGPGPNSTPLIAGPNVYSIGITGKFLCLDRKTGKVKWFHELICEYNSSTLGRGYGASPIAYKNTVIVPIGGGPGAAVMAFDQETGKVVWSKQDFSLTFATPMVIQFKGKDQLVVFMAKEVAGLDPNNGELLWSNPHTTQYDVNISSPLMVGEDMVFTSSAYEDGGSRVVKLEEKNGKIEPHELWFGRKLRLHFGNAVVVGDFIYGSSGDFGPAVFVAIDAKTGEVAWRSRDFAKANVVYADRKLYILDEDGWLVMADPTSDGLKILSKCHLLENNAWTVPTVVGNRMYVRDRKNIMALELG